MPSMMNARRAAAIAAEIIVNFAAPYAIFVWLKPAYGDVHALLASSLPPLIWSLLEFARHRRLDALSMLVLAGIVLSLLAFIGGGSVRMLQLRENLVGGLIALLFLGSAAIGKPLIYQLARANLQRRSAHEAASFETMRERPQFRRVMMIMTLVWGVGLLAQTALACVLVFSMPIARYLLVSPVLNYGTMGALTLWTVLYARNRRRRAEQAGYSPAAGGA